MSFDMNEVEKAKKIAILHYKLLAENKLDEWLEKTVKKRSQKTAKNYWWEAGRQRIGAGMSFTFKFFDEKYSSPTRLKIFFNRLDKDGKPSGTGQVPAIMTKDPDSNNEWRVDTGSY